jgi:hypothetical protein
MNATSSTTEGGNQAIGEVAIHIQEACLAAQDDSTEAEDFSSFRLNYVRVARAG